MLFVGIALIALGVDLGTKRWAFDRLGMPGVNRDRIEVLGDVLVLETSLNEGALFGIGQGMRVVFITLSAVAVGGIVCWITIGRGASDLLLNVSLALVTGGILGNLWDRLGWPGLTWPYGVRQGERVYAVRDWIHFEIPGVLDWPVFNVADSALVIGVTLLMWQSFRTGSGGAADASPAAS